jgi:hypothetical protein
MPRSPRALPRIRIASVLGLAFGGLVAGHWLAYAGAEHAREATADAHAWLAPASRLALVAVIATLATATLRRVIRPAGTVPWWGSVAARLFAFQATAVLAVEVSERLVAGAGLHDLPALMPLGIAAQALIAIIGAWLLRAAFRVGELLVAIVARPSRPRASTLSLVAAPAVARAVPLGIAAPVGLRAPPPSR